MNTPINISLANEISKFFTVIKKEKSKCFILFILTFIITSLFCFYLLNNSSYNATIIIKGKFINNYQLTEYIAKINSHIINPENNVLSSHLTSSISLNGIRSIQVVEIKSSSDLLQNKDDNKFKLFKMTIFLSKHPINKNIDIAIEDVLYEIQEIHDKDKELIAYANILPSAISELDSLIQVARDASEIYKSSIYKTTSQTIVMNSLFGEINSLITVRMNYTIDLQMHEKRNLIFKGSPAIITKSFSNPYLIYAFGFLAWICSLLFLGWYKLGTAD